MAIAIVLISAFIIMVLERTKQPESGDAGSTSPGLPTNEPVDDLVADEPEPDFFATEFAVFEPITFTGSGDDVVDLPASDGLLTARHDGRGFFFLQVLDENNETSDMALTSVGSYEGVGVYGMSARHQATTLEIQADGAWEITVSPIVDAPRLDLPQQGEGDTVFLHDGGPERWNITYSGDSFFTVTGYGSGTFSMDLLVADVGPYEGTVARKPGPSVVVISGDGDWSIEVA